MINKIKAFLTNKCCHEFNGSSYLWDFHRGGHDELYVRTAVRCKKCDFEKVSATRLPDDITTLLDASKLEIFTMGSQRKR